MMAFILYLLVGTYTTGTSEGIYVYQFNTETGKSNYVSMEKVDNPSYLTANNNHTFVYAVTENDGNPSYVNALSFDRTNGTLTLLNSQTTNGSAPCYLAMDPKEQFVVTANYGGGSISVAPVRPDGTLAETSQVIPFEGKSVDERQQTPHLHCVKFSPDGQFLFATDLGTDHIYRMNVNYTTPDNYLNTESITSFQVAAGSGPRHFIFHPTMPYAYLISELSGKVTVFAYNGQLKEIQSIEADSLHAAGSADIRISPDGKYLYSSNRLAGDGIAIFAINQANGHLTKVGYQPTGRHPRNFVLTPNGKYLLVACRDSHLIQVYQVNTATGLLTDTHQDIPVNKPVCLQFIQ